MTGYNRIPFPTLRAILLISAGTVVAAFVEWRFLVILDIIFLVFCGIDYIRIITYPVPGVHRDRPGRLSQGVSRSVKVALLNRGDRDLRIQVRDQTPLEWESAPIMRCKVNRGAYLKLDYRIRPAERGLFRFGNISLRVEGPLGLLFCSVAINAGEEVKVFPNLPAFHYQDLSIYRKRTGHQGLVSLKLKGPGREFESLREYVEGDDPRKIHWKATARLDRPIVQEYMAERNQNIMIIIDAGRLMCSRSEGKTKLDHALEAAIRLIHAALAGDDLAGILVFNDRILTFIPPKKGPGQLQLILDATVSLTPKLVEPQYEKALLLFKSKVKKRSLVVLFTDLLDEVASENLLTSLALLRPTHLPLCVAVRDSEWDSLLKQRPEDAAGIYKRAVLHETLRQRHMGLKGLVKKGALALDLIPSELSAKTLERYMEVKRRGLL